MNWQSLIDALASLINSWTTKFMLVVMFFWLLLPIEVFVRWGEAIWPSIRDAITNLLRAASMGAQP